MSQPAHQINSQLTPSAWASPRRGFGDLPSDGTVPTIPNTSQLLKQQGANTKAYLVNTTSSETGVSPALTGNFVDAILAGDTNRAAVEAYVGLFTVTLGPAVGGILQWIVSQPEQPPPCTIPGCNIPGQSRPCSSEDYTLETILTNNYLTGPYLLWQTFPGSFQDVFSRAIVAAWDSQVTAPNACSILQRGIDIMAWGRATAAALVVPFVTAWNLAHPPSANPAGFQTFKFTAPVSTANWGGDPIGLALASLGQAAGVSSDSTITIEVSAWTPTPGVFPPGTVFADNTPECGGGGYWDGKECVLPKVSGGTVTLVPVRAKSYQTGSATSGASATSIATGAAIAAGALALGTYLYARHKRVPVKTVVKSAWKKTGGRVHLPHHLHLPKLGRHHR